MYNFDDKPDRVSEKCRKWDLNIIRDKFGDIREDFIPMWIADMDFECAEPIIEALRKKVEHKIFGYSSNDSDKYFNAVCDWYKRRFNWEINRKDIISL